MSDDNDFCPTALEEVARASYAGRAFGIGKSYTETTPSEEDRRAFLWGKPGVSKSTVQVDEDVVAHSDGRRIVLVVGDTSAAERLTAQQLEIIRQFEDTGLTDFFVYDATGGMTNEQIDAQVNDMLMADPELSQALKRVSPSIERIIETCNSEYGLGIDHMVQSVVAFEDRPKTFRDFEGRRRDGSFKRAKRSKRRR